MTTSLRGTAITALLFGLFAAAPAVALAPITVNTKDPSPSIVTRPALVGSTQVVRLRENTGGYPHTLVRFKVYPETSGFRPTSSTCQGTFHTSFHRTGSNGTVTITLAHPKRLCKGIIYQAEALIGTGNVPDKFAHLCVRGRPSAGATGCESNPNYFS